MARIEGIWEDYRRWMQRKQELERALAELDREESLLLEELDRVEDQLAYYESLTREMKRTLDPPNLSRLLRSLSRA